MPTHAPLLTRPDAAPPPHAPAARAASPAKQPGFAAQVDTALRATDDGPSAPQSSPPSPPSPTKPPGAARADNNIRPKPARADDADDQPEGDAAAEPAVPGPELATEALQPPISTDLTASTTPFADPTGVTPLDRLLGHATTKRTEPGGQTEAGPDIGLAALGPTQSLSTTGVHHPTAPNQLPPPAVPGSAAPPAHATDAGGPTEPAGPMRPARLGKLAAEAAFPSAATQITPALPAAAQPPHTAAPLLEPPPAPAGTDQAHAVLPSPMSTPASAPPPGPLATADATSPPPPSRPHPIAQLAPTFTAIAQPNDSNAPKSLVIRLDPAELGHVQVRIDRPTGSPARVELIVERTDTLMMLMQDRPRLDQALNQAGVPPEGRTLQFNLASGDQGARDQPGHHPPTAWGGGNAAAEPSPVAPIRRWQRAGVDITA